MARKINKKLAQGGSDMVANTDMGMSDYLNGAGKISLGIRNRIRPAIDPMSGIANKVGDGVNRVLGVGDSLAGGLNDAEIPGGQQVEQSVDILRRTKKRFNTFADMGRDLLGGTQ